MDLEEELSRMSVIDITIAGASAYVGYALANGSLDAGMLTGIGSAIAFRTGLNAARGAIRSYREGFPIAEHALFGARYAASHALIYAGAGLLGGVTTEFVTRML
jgi:hypothetical protein